jgi:hypothetical protein
MKTLKADSKINDEQTQVLAGLVKKLLAQIPIQSDNLRESQILRKDSFV